MLSVWNLGGPFSNVVWRQQIFRWRVKKCWAWWCMSVIPTLKWCSEKGPKFQASLGYISRTYLREKRNGGCLTTSWLWVLQVLGKLNKDLDKLCRSSRESVDLLKVEYTRRWEQMWGKKLKALIVSELPFKAERLNLGFVGRGLLKGGWAGVPLMIDSRIFNNLYFTSNVHTRNALL
jgi:hypothetical protein